MDVTFSRVSTVNSLPQAMDKRLSCSFGLVSWRHVPSKVAGVSRVRPPIVAHEMGLG